MIECFLWIFSERRILSDDETPAIKTVRSEKREEKNNHKNDDDDDEDDEDDDLQQYLKRKEARQYVQIQKKLLYLSHGFIFQAKSKFCEYAVKSSRKTWSKWIDDK